MCCTLFGQTKKRALETSKRLNKKMNNEGGQKQLLRMYYVATQICLNDLNYYVFW